MSAAIELIEKMNRGLGKIASWCALVMMLAQIFSVIARYVFNYGIISVQESVIYGHALMFLLGSAYLLQTNGHVRVDIFYNGVFSDRTRRIIDLIGLVFFVLPVVAAILWVGLPYVVRSWATLEGSRQSGGIPGIFLLKSAILVFAVSVGAQAVVIALKLWTGTPNAEWHDGAEHG